MRRIISSILAILVLVLSCIPCNDAEAAMCTAGKCKTTMKAAEHDNCPAHQADLCSPFCTCSCCAGITLPVVVSFQVSKPFTYAERRLAVDIAQAIASIALPIWQPPKLV